MVYNANVAKVLNATKSEYHIPVLLEETINGLHGEWKSKNKKIIVDSTFGGGGHSAKIAKNLSLGDKIICIDKDNDAINLNKSRIQDIVSTNGATAVFVCDGFENIKNIVTEPVDAIMADLGVSSFQIDTAERGFSYMADGPLDMRMDKTAKRTAEHVVNNYSLERLHYIIKEFGEEKFANSISRAIVSARPIKSTGELSKIIVDAVPSSYWKSGGHPAKRTFQAIRIEVNGELEILEQFVLDATERLKPNGRLAIITFHSLEDRIIKQTFKLLATNCLCPPKTPKCICGHVATVDILTKKPICPTVQEIRNNPRSASAKLRILQKKGEEKNGYVA